MKYSLILIIATYFYSCSVNTDYSEKVIIKNNPHINHIDSTYVKNIEEKIGNDTIIFYVANARHLKDIKKDAFFIYVWADWCKPCIEKLPELVQYSKANNDRILFVGLDYYYPGMYRLLKKHDFSGNAYILDAKDYSNKVWDKLRNLKLELCPDCGPDKKPGVPSIYLINSNDSTVFFDSRSMPISEMDSLYKVFN